MIRRGIWAAVLTPVDGNLVPDAGKAVPYYRELLESGCDGINLLGTTGEAMSFSVRRRVGFMEAIASSGLPMDRMMAGTGAAALDDAVRLARCALDCGFAAALVMPPFFFRDTCDAGIVVFYEELLARTNPPLQSLLLYNFPKMSGITLHPHLVDRLIAASEGRIFGMKDSSNDARLQAELLARRPEFAVYPGSESNVRGALSRGAAGCISGSVALWPQLAQTVFSTEDEAAANELNRRRAALDGMPFVAAVRHLTATQRSDASWNRAMPPQRSLNAEQRHALSSARE